MSPICQTFVQNAWRKDLCSNCFKSEEEHGNSRGKNLENGSNGHCYTDGSGLGRRYVSVAGRPGLYPRNYYGSKSWNPLMLDNSNNDSRILKSPGLIKGMDSIIRQENEKNRNLNGLGLNDTEDVPQKKIDNDVTHRSNIPKDSWILTQIIGDTKLKSTERSERIQGDSSSDLGSDSSHDTSGNTSGCSDGEVKGDSDASSVRSEQDSAHEEEPPVPGILKTTPINHPRTIKASISFNEEDEIIGYGGDVNYSDDDDYEDDDDDDNSSISSSELSPEERYIKHLTERNTNFNSENENLEKDLDNGEALNSLEISSPKDDFPKYKIEKMEDSSNKQEVKVKLKRSQPILGAKPNIKSNFSSSYSASPPNSQNTQSGNNNRETIPMQGIKPKFVSRENEMRENSHYEDMYENNCKTTSVDNYSSKVTSIDEISPKVTKIDTPQKITSIDDVIAKITPIDITPKVTSVDDITAKVTSVDDVTSKVTSVDDISPKVTSEDVIPKVTRVDDIIPKVTSTDTSPKMTSIDEVLSEIKMIENVRSKVSSTDNNRSLNGPLKATSVGNFPSKTTSPQVISPLSSEVNSPDNDILKDTSKMASAKATNDSSTKQSEEINSHTNTAEKISSKENCVQITYIDDMGTYERHSRNSSSSNCDSVGEKEKLPDSVRRKKSEDIASEQKHSRVPETDRDPNSKVANNIELDHSVRSAQNTYFTEKTSAKTRLNDKTDDKTIVKVIDNSNENLDKVSSGVVPLNMITIQRRSSFMESQLGGTVFSIESTVDVTSNQKNTKGNEVVATSEQKCSGTEKRYPATSQIPHTDRQQMSQKRSVGDRQLSLSESPIKEPHEGGTTSGNLYKTVQAKEKQDIHVTSQTIDTANVNREALETKDKQPVVVDVKDQLVLRNEHLPKKSSESEVKSNSSDNNSGNAYSEDVLNKGKLSPSNSNSMSTFGTPVASANPPNNSFLHSGAVRPLTEAKEINSIIYSTPEFLRGIKPSGSQLPVTASIQKSALHAPSSSIKGVSLSKPATTPKPNYLKDKPKVPVKPFMSTSKIYSREVGSERKLEAGNSSTQEKTSTENHVNSNEKTAGSSSSISQKPSQVQVSPETPDSKEIVYDIPVPISYPSSPTILSAPSPSSSSGYSSSTNVSQSCETAMAISQENKSDPSKLPDRNESITRVDDDADESLSKENCASSQNTVSETLSSEDKKSSSAKMQEKNEEVTSIIKVIPVVEDVASVAKELSTKMSENNAENVEENEHLLQQNKQNDEQKTIELRSDANAYHPHEFIDQPSYVNLRPPYDCQDVDSYSSFTDDFDDDDDEDDNEGDFNTNKMHFINIDNRQKALPLRRTERSSSATPLFRNSVGPINFNPISTIDTASDEMMARSAELSKPPAVRSQSVPRSADHVINPSIFGKIKPESSSRFGFVKSGKWKGTYPEVTSQFKGFFRPSSPPSMKRKSSSERGRDRTKKSLSVFSLRKLLRFGSGEKSLKGAKEPKSPKDHDGGYHRETRKLKLHIIHPLDYNTNGVEVIARPEKKSPTYDFTGINDPLIQEALKQHALEINEKKAAEASLSKIASNTAFVSQSPKKEENFTKNTKVAKKNSFLRRRRKPERNESERSETSSVASYVAQKDNLALKKEDELNKSNSNNNVSNQSVTHVPVYNRTTTSLGFNSEGRPRPPPPPRKTSLDANAQFDGFKPSMNPSRPNNPEFNFSNRSSTSSKTEGDTSSLSSSCSSSTRPHRPPPPRRTPSNSGTSQGLGCPRTNASLYANLGNARASFTPRKPGRTSSMKDEDREKRKAPNPPLPSQHQVQLQHQPQPQSQTQVSSLGLKAELSGAISDRPRSTKGPAPMVPVTTDSNSVSRAHDYECITDANDEFYYEATDSSSAYSLYDLPLSPTRNNFKEHETTDGYIIPGYALYSHSQKKEGAKPDAVASATSSSSEKTHRQKGRRGSVVTNLSLEDQYGAVIFANLEALSNMLDQICNYPECDGYESVKQQVAGCSQIIFRSRDPISCGIRLFYPGTAANCNVTVMVTPEAKVEVDPLMIPKPILTFKDDISPSILPSWRSSEHSFSSGSVWILPEMTISSLEEFSHNSQRLLQERPSEWERRICLFLLQVVSALKQLQAKGTEEISLDMILIITSIYGEDNPRLLMSSSDGSSGSISGDNSVSLCQCAAAVTQLLLGHNQPLEGAMKGPILSSPLVPSPHAFSALVTCLREERSGSLTKAKCILETMLFGPEDMKGSMQADGESALQKWLDLERASLLHSLVREQASGQFNRNCLLTKFHLLFLVRTNVKALKEAVKVLEAPDVTDF